MSVALRNLVLFLGAASMMVVTSPRLSGFVLGAIPVIVLPLVAFGRMVRKRSRGAQDTLAEASAYAAEVIGGVRTLQAYTQEQAAAARFAGFVERAFLAARESTRARAMLTAIVIFLVFASVVLVLWVGAQDVLAHRITPGRLSQFVLYAVFAAGALGELSQVSSEIAQTSGAAERLFELLSVEPAIKAPADPLAMPEPARGAVAFEAVRFAYPRRPDTVVLDGLSLRVAAGERIALVGPSGAGKSTIFHLLLRFYDPLAGDVRFDGAPLRRLDPAALRRAVALVPQDVTVFSGSIADNIRFGRPEASNADVARAAEQALVAEFAGRLPQGLATPIGERGMSLSGRPAPAGRDRARDPARCAAAAARRGDLGARCRKRDAGAGGARRLMAGRTTMVIAHRWRRSPPATAFWCSTTAASSRKARMRHSRPPAGFMRGWRSCNSRQGDCRPNHPPSFRGARKASVTGIHNPELWLWAPALRRATRVLSGERSTPSPNGQA